MDADYFKTVFVSCMEPAPYLVVSQPVSAAVLALTF